VAPLKKALTLDPSYALAHYQLGRVLARTGRYPEARDELEKAIALQHDLLEAYYQLGHTYLRLGEQQKAEQALATFKKYRGVEYSERQEVLKQMQHAVAGGP
jgi:tetratricopeptide (TPR) repeat protein